MHKNTLSNMKIVHLVDYFQPKVGYQEYFLALEHQKLGHDIRVITSDYYFPFVNYDHGGSIYDGGVYSIDLLMGARNPD